ncbi:MAG TPA: ABC transporter permease [Kiloniellales bacterium]|nr:ABC transporter permease [Kiloniellales bacterium]
MAEAALLVRRAVASRSFLIGALLTGLIVVTAAVSLVWTPHDAIAQNMAGKLQGSSAEHWLGTDHYGRDVLSRLMVGARNSIVVGLVAVGLGLSLGVLLGAAAAARGGWLDELLSRVSDLVFAFPAVLSAVLITAVYGPGAVNAIIAIGIFNVPVFARVTRAAARQAWARDYVRAALALGRTPVAVTRRHVLPNIVSLLIVQATIQFAIAILAEAALSFLGLGVQPPAPSWGRMLNDALTYMYVTPGIAIYPGLAIVLAVLGLNLLGDGLRDLLDPRLRRLR